MSWTEELIRLILPEGILEEFELRRIEEREEVVRLYLDERIKTPQLPEAYKRQGVRSKGFTLPTEIQDFPIREKKCVLVIRRLYQINKRTFQRYYKDNLSGYDPHTFDEVLVFANNTSPAKISRILVAFSVELLLKNCFDTFSLLLLFFNP